MKSLNKAGFTIIESMLFLAISGALIAGVLVSTGSSINIQRYRDSATSLRSFLQQQYSEVSNVTNDSTNNACYGDGSSNPRGQSDCVILGRYIKTTDSKNILVKTVIGYPGTGADTESDDVEVLKLYNIQVSSSVGNSSYEIEWGSTSATADGTPMVFSVLILRSPSSGIIRTFIDNKTAVSDITIGDLLNATPSALTNDAMICLDSNDLFTGAKLAVYLEKNATSANGVETRGEDSGCK